MNKQTVFDNLEDLLDHLSRPSSENVDGNPGKYYGIQIPNSKFPLSRPFVIRSLPSRKQLTDFCPTARFKQFTNPEDALLFSTGKLQLPVDVNFRRTPEPKSPYPSPSNAEKAKLYSAVCDGDLKTIKQMVLKNPRLLVTPDDSTEFYKGVWRQTLLYTAISKEHFDVFCLLLEIIESNTFVKATQLTQYEDLEERSQVIVRNYLQNRSTKSMESVLDTAVIYGMMEVVDFLTVHPVAPRKLSPPVQNTGPCLKASKERKVLADDITSFISDRYYLPLLQSEAGSIDIGRSIDPDMMIEHLREGRIRAFIGPTTKANCDEAFRRVQSGQNPKTDRKVPEKMPVDVTDGLQCFEIVRTARVCAKELKLPWKEWWSFLGIFVDLCSKQGLLLFEVFLSKLYIYGSYVANADRKSHPRIERNLDVVETLSLFYNPRLNPPPEIHEEDDEEVASPTNEVFYTPPSSPEDPQVAFSRFCERHLVRRRFIGGNRPSAEDFEAFAAIKPSSVSLDGFPYVKMWMILINNNGSRPPSRGIEPSSAESLDDDVLSRLSKLTL